MDDNVSMAAWSQASETDRILFSVLSNTDRIDLASLPRVAVDGPTTQGDLHSQDRELPRISEETETPVIEEVLPARVYGESTNDVPDASSMPRFFDDVPTTVPPSSQQHSSSEPLHASSSSPPADAAYATNTTAAAASSSFSAYAPRDPVEPAPPAMASFVDPPKDLSEPQSYPPAPSQPAPPSRSVEEERELELQKRTVLIDLQRLELQGVRLTRQWDMSDPLEDMTLELRKHILIMDEQQNVSMLRDGLKMCVTAIEMVNNRLGLLDLEGWSSEVSRDMNKHNANLARIYRKYWRRSVSNTPEADIAFSILGSMGMHHVKRTMSKQMLARGRGGGGARGNGDMSASHRAGSGMFRRPAVRPRNDDGLSSSSEEDDEEAPPQKT